MLKIWKSLAALLVLSSMAATVARADEFVEGKNYFRVTPVVPTSTGSKVEVLEAFSYGCPHCAHFQPTVEAWRQHMDSAHVQLVYLPATFRPDFQLLARGFFAIQSMNLVDATHGKFYDKLWASPQGAQIRDLDQIADIYATLGVKKADFMQAAQSFFVESQLRKTEDLYRRYGIEGTPTLIVNGKYRITTESAGDYDKIFPIVDFLVKKELTPTAPTAVKTTN
jgi:protein dithiol oxidoreductase (disulfide-forming)